MNFILLNLFFLFLLTDSPFQAINLSELKLKHIASSQVRSGKEFSGGERDSRRRVLNPGSDYSFSLNWQDTCCSNSEELFKAGVSERAFSQVKAIKILNDSLHQLSPECPVELRIKILRELSQAYFAIQDFESALDTSKTLWGLENTEQNRKWHNFIKTTYDLHIEIKTRTTQDISKYTEYCRILNHYSQNKWRDSRAVAIEACKQFPQDINFIFLLLDYTGEPLERIDLLKKAISIAPDSYRAHLLFGKFFLERGYSNEDYNMAAQELTLSVKLAKELSIGENEISEILELLGISLLRLGNKNEALKAGEEALKFCSSDSSNRMRILTFLENLKNGNPK